MAMPHFDNSNQRDFLHAFYVNNLMIPPTLAENKAAAKATSDLLLDNDTCKLFYLLKNTQSTTVSSQIVRRLLQKAGTDCDKNDADPLGDGDQSLVESNDSDRQILRQLYSDGDDVLLWMRLGSNNNNNNSTEAEKFVWNCVKGDARAVERALKKKAKNRTHLLEQRVTAMRWSPLILTIAISKLPELIQRCTGQPIRAMNHVEVVHTLLKYGARPNAKDVTGKTVCHYGAGSRATEESMKMVDMCLRATMTCSMVGKKVILQGLSKEEFNGMEGTLGGFVHNTGRCVFHPLDEPTKEMAVKPENIFVPRDNTNEPVCILDKSIRATNLVDVRDRVGSISLHEVAMSTRGDVAKFLLKRSTACLDIVDCTGKTPRSLFMVSISGPSPVQDAIRSHMKTTTKQKEWKVTKKETCEECGIQAKALGKPLMICENCLDAGYCSAKCQRAHWKKTHKNVCKAREAALGLVLGPAAAPQPYRNHNTGQIDRASKYNPPDGVKTNQKFWVKVQCDGLHSGSLIYDETRTCHFSLAPGTLGHKELVESVSACPSFMGRKAFYRAKFNEEGRCVVFLHTCTIKKW